MSVLNIIYSDLKEFWVFLNNFFFYRRQAFKMTLAIAMADIKQKAFNKRYFIVMIDLPTGNKLMSINNKDFEVLKRVGWLPKGMNTLELEEKCFYQTKLSLNNTMSKEARKKAKDRYSEYAKRYMRK